MKYHLLVKAYFLEGFLSVYGIELERAVKRYEEKLQLFETMDRERKQCVIFVERLKQVELSPSFETEQQAKVQLEAIKNQLQKERVPQQQLDVVREE